jgi:hypothetical protein
MSADACQKGDTRNIASENSHSSRVVTWSLAAIVLASLILRALCATGELWLDEILTLHLIRGIRYPWEILTSVHHDNNHLLNSLWMWSCGETAPSWLHRLPSVLFAPASVYLLARSGRVLGEPVVGVIWALLVAVSYVFILSTSEARGYSLEVFCVALCFHALVHVVTSSNPARAARTFGVFASLGMLAHASFFLFLGPAAAWLVSNCGSRASSAVPRKVLYTAIVPPMITTLALTVFFYAHMIIGGAPLAPYSDVAITTLSVAVGGEALSATNQTASRIALVCAIIALGVAFLEYILWRRESSPIASLAGMVIVSAPIAVEILQPEFILPRYFLIALLFLYLFFAHFIVRLSRSGSLGKVIGALILTLFVFFNTKTTLLLWQQGRSHFIETFQLIAATQEEKDRTVGGAQDAQNSYRLAYARTIEPSLDSITYINGGREALTPPKFIIWETLDGYEEFPATWTSKRGATYERVSDYHPAPLNGSTTFLYRLVEK